MFSSTMPSPPLAPQWRSLFRPLFSPDVQEAISFYLPATSSMIPTIYTSLPTYSIGSEQTFFDFEGLLNTCSINEACFGGARRVENLASGLTTQNVTVIVGREYQITMKGATGDTVVASNAFTGTLTGVTGNRISWNSGTPKTATTTTLTLTVTGTLTELQVEDVTGQTVQIPSENVSKGVLSAPYHGANVDGVQFSDRDNSGNSVDGDGVVTEALGDLIADSTLLGIKIEPQSTNKCTNYNVIGPDQLGSDVVINGGFDTDSDWTKGTGWSIGGGVASCDGSQSAQTLLGSSANILTGGVRYRISVTLTVSAGSVRILAGGSGDLRIPEESSVLSESGTYEFDLTSGATKLYIRGSLGFVGTVDNVSAIAIGGTNVDTGSLVSGLATNTTAFFFGVAWRNPIPNMTLSADTAGILSIVEDIDDPSGYGKVYKLDNSSGATSSYVSINPALGNAEAHINSILYKGGTGLIGFTGATADTALLGSAEYVLAETPARTPGDAWSSMLIGADPGQTIYFILNKSEAQPLITSHIIVQRAAATRNVSTLTAPIANINLSKGSYSGIFHFGTDVALWPDGTYRLVSLNDGNDFIYMTVLSGVGTLVLDDGTTQASLTPFTPSGFTHIAAYWFGTTMGLVVDSVAGTPAAFVSQFPAGTVISWCGSTIGTMHVKQQKFYRNALPVYDLKVITS